MCKHCQTEAGSIKDCSHSKMGTNVEFIIAQTVVQRNNKGGGGGGTMYSKGGPDKATITVYTKTPGSPYTCNTF